MAEASDRYPGIKRAALEIAYDNGGIHRDRSEKQMLRELSNFLDRQPEELLSAIDVWLARLSAECLEIVCAGEQFEADAVLRDAPPFTLTLLNDYFNEVC